MRKTERLDQILIRLGYATQKQIQEAVDRQESVGGRFGENIVELGFVSQEQLFDALVEQFRVPTIRVSEGTLDETLLDRMPLSALVGRLLVPVGWNDQLKVLNLAVANPSDEEGIAIAAKAFGARKVRISIAPESVLRTIVAGRGEGDVGKALAAEAGAERTNGGTGAGGYDPGELDVQLVALPELFEGIHVEVAGTIDEVKEVLAEHTVERVLVEDTMQALVDDALRSGVLELPPVPVVPFSSVAEAIFDSAVPYRRMAQSLRGAVGSIAELRCARSDVSPPYGLMAGDLAMMAARLGMSRVAADGLYLGLHTLLPAPAGRSIDPFLDFTATLEVVAKLRFPWPIDRVLGVCQGLFVGRLDLADLDDPGDEVSIAAQLLAVVWFRHNLLETEAHDEEGQLTEVRTRLRELAGRVASLELIEGYLDIIAERGDLSAAKGQRPVLLVGGERIERAFTPALGRLGYDCATVDDTGKAQSAVEETDPAAILIDHQIFGIEVDRFGQVLKLGRSTPLFALTDSDDPALVLNLLDIGVDDVFAPPHDVELIAARVHRAIRSRTAQHPSAREPGSFSATLEAFSFLDLAQMLSHGMKSVRVDLVRPGEQATLYLAGGTPVYAACGELRGPEAVYAIIAWEDRGEFTVHEDASAPEKNLAESTESLLMEGVRLLDESRVV